jgi:hypothetical protein
MYCSFPHGVISGTTSLCEINEYPAYSRALGGIFGSHIPEKSGSPQAVLGTCQAPLEASDLAAAGFPFAGPEFPEFCASSAQEHASTATSATDQFNNRRGIAASSSALLRTRDSHKRI